MSTLAQEAARLVDQLPEAKAQALIDYARYLVEQNEESEWERRFNDSRYQPKFAALVNEVKREIGAGLDQPLDLDRL